MPRICKRKTGWGSRPVDEMERAATEVKTGNFIQAEAKERKIDRSALSRFMQKKEDKEVKTLGYSRTAERKKVFTEDKQLEDYIKTRLTSSMTLFQRNAVDERLNLHVLDNWRKNGYAGREGKS